MKIKREYTENLPGKDFEKELICKYFDKGQLVSKLVLL
jgi:hypothetical protein